ncbi:exodeoxyribonuclease VII small subunit [Corynebacterium sp. CCM 9185]|uniref:Exodeoxyribonuclease 7 small subunit n=1 Tax=Corynebacterium marambiense TaxID=2765364 RepID=A0ABS0VUP6_9CORY|nr:exodeoxyribonuclease VII small subunit [Corynebacterium marambiense]MBI9000081.1 exodeoxyribonuclease VII small subunit [Corynebacterium marambiense]MCK7663433.1 exodeoxyribonuclease VII small subunit [Corynebacterium marambiense]MCX7542133.1 exodeoxyribonuclease VII small subunit [Corynebacterium marambiense]
MNSDAVGTGQPGENAFPAVSELSYEAARDELVEIVKILEHGQMPLDESLNFWERGEALAKRCEEHLDGARNRVEAILRSDESDVLTEDTPDTE